MMVIEPDQISQRTVYYIDMWRVNGEFCKGQPFFFSDIQYNIFFLRNNTSAVVSVVMFW